MLLQEGAISETSLNLRVAVDPGSDSTASASFDLSCAGCGDLQWSALLFPAGDTVTKKRGGLFKPGKGHAGPRATAELDALWDNLLSFDASTSAEDTSLIAAVTTPNNILALGQHGFLYTFDHTGEYGSMTAMPDEVSQAVDLAWDPEGQIITGNADGNIYALALPDLNITLLGNIGIPVSSIAYDYDTHNVYVFSGNQLRALNIDTGVNTPLIANTSLGNVTGLAYMPSDPDDFSIWILHTTAEGEARITRYNPWTGFYDLPGPPLYEAGTGRAGGLTISEGFRQGMLDLTTVLDGGVNRSDRVDIWEGYPSIPSWLNIVGNHNGVLSTGQGRPIVIEANLQGANAAVQVGTDLHFNLVLDGPYWENPPVVPVTVSFYLGTDEVVDGLPTKYMLHQNYPNPFNPSTTIQFDLVKAQPVHLTIYNVLGQQVRELIPGERYEAGFHRVVLDASDLASGIYFMRFDTPVYQSMKKLIVLK